MDNEDLEKLGEVYTTFTRAKCADEVLRSFKHYVQVSQEVASLLISGAECDSRQPWFSSSPTSREMSRWSSDF